MNTLRHTPQEFYALPVGKKPHWLAMAYMERCGEGWSKKSLFALKNYFAKVDVTEYQILYDYLHSLTQHTPCSLYDIYEVAHRHQLQLRVATKGSVEVQDYPSLLSCLNKL